MVIRIWERRKREAGPVYLALLCVFFFNFFLSFGGFSSREWQRAFAHGERVQPAGGFSTVCSAGARVPVGRLGKQREQGRTVACQGRVGAALWSCRERCVRGSEQQQAARTTGLHRFVPRFNRERDLSAEVWVKNATEVVALNCTLDLSSQFNGPVPTWCYGRWNCCSMPMCPTEWSALGTKNVLLLNFANAPRTKLVAAWGSPTSEMCTRASCRSGSYGGNLTVCRTNFVSVIKVAAVSRG